MQIDRDYASDFHLFRVNWTPKGIQFYTDDELIGEVYPPAGGFWELGGFEGDNLWKNSINPIMTPFDRPVIKTHQQIKVHIINNNPLSSFI